MRLPNGDAAEIDDRKLKDYLLSTSHPVGRFKAAYLARLGFTLETSDALSSELRRLVAEADAVEVPGSPHGRKFLVSGEIHGPSGDSGTVVTVWIIEYGRDNPRLVTVYPE